jgi:rod shape determining protein RodA
MRISLQRRVLDWWTLAIVLALSGVGLVLVASSTFGGRSSDLVARQAMWIGIGLVGLFLSLTVDYRVLLRFSFAIYLVSLIPLCYLLLFGRAIAHVHSWLRIGGVQFQPAELAKLTTALLVGYFFENEEESRLKPVAFARVASIVLVPFVLTFFQPDLGLALTFLPLVFVAMYFGGLSWKWWVMILLVGVLACGGGWLMLKDYQKHRIVTFLHPQEDIMGAGYQVQQSKIAVGSGGLFGKGFRKGTQNQLRFLPVRHTDFIFAVLAEEWGFLGVLTVLGLYAAFFWRALAAARHARDRGGLFLVLGLTAMIFFSVLLNTGMIIGLFPTTGIPLPLLSYGGSSIATTFLAIGLILNVESRRFANV